MDYFPTTIDLHTKTTKQQQLQHKRCVCGGGGGAINLNKTAAGTASVNGRYGIDPR